jgi:GTPase SAR1 family protein
MVSPQELDAIKSSGRLESGLDLHRQIFIYLHTPPQRLIRCVTVSEHCQTLLSIVCIGEFGVGKSALLHRFATGDFNEDFNPIIDKDYLVAAYQKDSTEGRKDESGTIEVHFYDSAGQERFKLVDSHWQYPRMIHTILLAYSVDNRSSFETLRY